MPDKTVRVELPPGSGRWAVYSPAEQEYVRTVIAAARAAGRSKEERAEEVLVLHELKVAFGVDLTEDEVDESGYPIDRRTRPTPRDPSELPVSPAPETHVGPNPEDTIREAFLRFHADNPHVYDELVMLARRAISRGATRLGIKMMFEVLRWRHTLRTGGDDFKLNNNYHSYYARLIMSREADLGDVFELRKLHGQGLSRGDVE